jgi:hypothetical protein
VSERTRERWAGVLTTVGWLFLVGYLAEIAVQIDRARRITTSSFSDGVWGQRVEVLSFVVIPQGIIILVPAAAAAVAAVLLARGTLAEHEPWHGVLVRAVAGTAIVAIALAVVHVLVVVFDGTDDDAGDFGSLVRRMGGLAMAAAIVRICLEAERERQVPSSPSR